MGTEWNCLTETWFACQKGFLNIINAPYLKLCIYGFLYARYEKTERMIVSPAAGNVQYVVSPITLEAFVKSSPNLVKMCIGLISWTS